MFDFLVETHNHKSLDDMDLEELILERELDKQNLYVLENGFFASLDYGLWFATSRKAAQLWHKATGRYEDILEELRGQVARDKEEIFERGADKTRTFDDIEKLKGAETKQKWRDRRRYVLEEKREHNVIRDVEEARERGMRFTPATIMDFLVYRKPFVAAATALALGIGLYFGAGFKLQYDNAHRRINLVRMIEHEHPAVSASRAAYNTAMLTDDVWNFVNANDISRSEPQLEGKNYRIEELIEESQGHLDEAMNFLKQFDAPIRMLNDGGKGVFAGWRHWSDDNYHTEIRVRTWTDEDGDVHMETYTEEVYDDTDFYWEYDSSITGRAVPTLKNGVELLSENPPEYIDTSGLRLRGIPREIIKEQNRELSDRQRKKLLAELNSWIDGSIPVRGINYLASNSEVMTDSTQIPFIEQNFEDFPRSYHINRERTYFLDEEAPTGYVECRDVAKLTVDYGSTFFDLMSRVKSELQSMQKLEQGLEDVTEALGSGDKKTVFDGYRRMSETSIGLLRTLNDSDKFGRLSQKARTLISVGIGFLGLVGGAAGVYFGISALENRGYRRRMGGYGIY